MYGYSFDVRRLKVSFESTMSVKRLQEFSQTTPTSTTLEPIVGEERPIQDTISAVNDVRLLRNANPLTLPRNFVAPHRAQAVSRFGTPELTQ